MCRSPARLQPVPSNHLQPRPSTPAVSWPVIVSEMPSNSTSWGIKGLSADMMWDSTGLRIGANRCWRPPVCGVPWEISVARPPPIGLVIKALLAMRCGSPESCLISEAQNVRLQDTKSLPCQARRPATANLRHHRRHLDRVGEPAPKAVTRHRTPRPLRGEIVDGVLEQTQAVAGGGALPSRPLGMVGRIDVPLGMRHQA